MKTVIIILARKGSKRIPNKNFKLFNGKPLIHYTLDLANKLEYPVYFYSDCDKMRKYAARFDNINIREKPKRFADDHHDTCKELLYYNKELNADVFVNLQVTSPIRSLSLVKSWIEDFNKQKDFKSGMSVYKLPKKFFYMGGEAINFAPKKRDNNYKPEYPIYSENGSFYIFKKEMLKYKRFIQMPCKMYLDITGIELDYDFQWQSAEVMQKQILGDVKK
jgi:CMP-N,N'-diacetyllegionaminic acid synthase